MPNWWATERPFFLPARFRHINEAGFGDKGGGAEIVQCALLTEGFASETDGAPMIDQHVREVQPVLSRNNLHEVLFNFDGAFVDGPAETPHEATNMRIDDDSLDDAKSVAQDDVSGFAGDAGQGEQFGHSTRDLASEVGDDALGGGANISGFIAIEAG